MKDKNKDQRPIVLVVDDDTTMRLLIREVLEQADIIVEEAKNGTEALSVFKRLFPDLVLMDVKMPGIDGFTSCAQIRQAPGGGDVPIIMVTGLDDIESIERAYKVGATDFVTKPINWTTLQHRMRYMVRASKAIQDLRRSEARLSQAQQIARLGNWEWDLETDALYWSDEIYRIFGLDRTANTLSYDTFVEYVHPNDRASMKDAVHDALSEKKSYMIDYRIVLPDGRERIVRQQGKTELNGDEKPIRMLGIIQDITQRKKVEGEIRTLAYYDHLTGLPNRQLFMDYTIRALNIAQRNHTRLALIYLDLDGFKHINDTVGHSAGDESLKTLSDILIKQLRNSDIVTRIKTGKNEVVPLARVGGDEFTILLTNFTNRGNIPNVARRILDAISGPITVKGREFYITGSIGIAIYPEDGADVDTLLKKTDMAMYEAKKKGGNGFHFYSELMTVQVLKRLSLENKLRKAVERDELMLHYQPQMAIQTGEIIGLEALVRWNHPELGHVPPNDFIPLAEQTGLILPIGEWVFRTACKQAKAWQDRGGTTLTIAVNVSALQLEQEDFVKTVAGVISETGVNPHSLKLEMTESILMKNVEEVITRQNQLKEIGVRVSIDDFGTGYSSLGYLKRFPIESLKIDKSFVNDIFNDSDNAAITRAIIALSHSLRLQVIAEGVETEEQLEFLRVNHCDAIQGYLVSRPLPSDEVSPFLNQRMISHPPLD
ncbi:MAG: EAL domain-containing protein [Nitrospiria bacterium]